MEEKNSGRGGASLCIREVFSLTREGGKGIEGNNLRRLTCDRRGKKGGEERGKSKFEG